MYKTFTYIQRNEKNYKAILNNKVRGLKATIMKRVWHSNRITNRTMEQNRVQKLTHK